MTSRTKLTLAIIATMFATTTLLTVRVVGNTLAQYRRVNQHYEQTLAEIVDAWVEATIPGEANRAQLYSALDAYRDQPPGLFTQIVLVDRFGRIVDAFGTDPQATARLVLGFEVADLPERGGARVEAVPRGSATARAGLLAGDLIVACEGQAVTGVAELTRLASAALANGPTRLTIQRDGRPRELTLPVANKLDDPLLARVLKDGRTAIDGSTVYRAVTAPVPPSATELPPIEFAFRLKVGLAPPPTRSEPQIVGPVFWVMGLGTVLLILVIYVLLTRLIFRPLDKLAGVSRRVARGDYSQRLTPEAPTRDELGQLLRAFDGMMREVHSYQTELEERVEGEIAKTRQAEQRLIIAQRLGAIGTLAAGIAHEINNPLSGVTNAARSLHKRLKRKFKAELDKRDREYFELITDGLGRIEGLVKEMLQFSRRRFSPEPFAIVAAAETAAGLARHNSKFRRANVAITIAPPAPDLPRCFGEQGEIEQVFLNLFINGVDAIRERRRAEAGRDATSEPRSEPDVIEVAFAATPEGIEARVRDTGCGMDAEQTTQVFDAFYTTKSQGEGTGLGMFMVHNIIESHGGSIRLETAPGAGTTVIFTIPMELAE